MKKVRICLLVYLMIALPCCCQVHAESLFPGLFSDPMTASERSEDVTEINRWAVTNRVNVYLRTEPGQTAAFVAVLPEVGTKIFVSARIVINGEETWYAVLWDDQLVYVRGDLLEVTDEVEPDPYRNESAVSDGKTETASSLVPANHPVRLFPTPVPTPSPSPTSVPTAVPVQTENPDLCPTCHGKKVCFACSGNGKCEKCRGRKTIPCRACDGNGSCSKCNGLGTILSEFNPFVYENGFIERQCVVCKGEKKCTVCKGNREFRCDTCDATGICAVCGGKKKCPTCGGTGKKK